MKHSVYALFAGYNKLSKIPTLYLNAQNNKYHCVRCGVGGYSTGLYAKVRNISTQEAFKELLSKECFSMDSSHIEISPINLLADIEIRDKVYRSFLNMLKLETSHRNYLKGLGLLDSSINAGLYKTIPTKYIKRRLICSTLSRSFNLSGIPRIFSTR